MRTLGEADCGFRYLGWMRDPDVQRFLESRGTAIDLDGLIAFVAAANASPATLLLGLMHPDGETHVGNIKLGPIDARHARASIGVMIGDKACWGLGLASEAIDALAGVAFGEFGVAKLTAGAYIGNRASIRAFERAGFAVEATLARHAVLDGERHDIVLMARHAP